MSKNEDGGTSLDSNEPRPRRHRPRKPSARTRVRDAGERDGGESRNGGAERLDGEGLAAVGEGLSAIVQALETQVRERPYVALAAAAGAGFVIAQTLRSNVGRVALVAAGGYAVTRLMRGDGMQMLERLLGGDGEEDEIDEPRDRTPPVTSTTPQ